MDGYPDVAVGAPYENNGQGAIYIYHGHRFGLKLQYSQRIIPSAETFLRGFGVSISSVLDIDGNCHKDIAVGAYLSGHVVLLKAYPVVTVLAKFNSSLEKIPFATEDFGILICLSYAEKYTSLNIDIAVTLKSDEHFHRTSFDSTSAKNILHYNATLQANKQHCQNFSVFIKNKSEFTRPIEFSLKYKLKDPAPMTLPSASEVYGNKSEKFCKHCAVTNPESSSMFTWKVQYVPDGFPADLHLIVYFENVSSPYIIGSSDVILIGVVLQNYKAQAIESQILVEFPLYLLKKVTPPCTETSNDATSDNMVLICDIKSPFLNEDEHRVSITLDMTKVPFDLSELKLKVTASSISLEENEEDNQALLHLPLERIFDLEIHGKSVEYSFVHADFEMYDDESAEHENGKYKFFKNDFHVVNNGPSPATNIELYFEIPQKISHSGVQMEVVSIIEQIAYLEQQPISCTAVKNVSWEIPEYIPVHNQTLFPFNRTYVLSCSENYVQCKRIKCTVSTLLPRSSDVKLSFALKVMTEKLGAVTMMKDIILIKTHGYIHSSLNKYVEVQSVVWTKPFPMKVDTGIVAIGIACGCLILLTLVLILIKCGFFRRLDPMERYFRKRAALTLEENKIPPSTFYSPRGSIMVF